MLFKKYWNKKCKQFPEKFLTSTSFCVMLIASNFCCFIKYELHQTSAKMKKYNVEGKKLWDRRRELGAGKNKYLEFAK